MILLYNIALEIIPFILQWLCAHSPLSLVYTVLFFFPSSDRHYSTLYFCDIHFVTVKRDYVLFFSWTTAYGFQNILYINV